MLRQKIPPEAAQAPRHARGWVAAEPELGERVAVKWSQPKGRAAFYPARVVKVLKGGGQLQVRWEHPEGFAPLALVKRADVRRLPAAHRARHPAARQHDPDGPSRDDLPYSAWAAGGKGTTDWMLTSEGPLLADQPGALFSDAAPATSAPKRAAPSKPARQAPKSAAHPPAPATPSNAAAAAAPPTGRMLQMIRNAPALISEALHLPLARVRRLQKLIDARAALGAGGVVQGSMLLANASAIEACNGKYEGCEALAADILETAKAIESKCLPLFLDAAAYRECEADSARPLCGRVQRDFPRMCEDSGYTVGGGYIGGEDPANVRGEVCSGCAQLSMGNGGCLAGSSVVEVLDGRDIREATLGSLAVEDRVRSVDDHGRSIFSRVYFIHDHPRPALTVRLGTAAAGGFDELELTPDHPLPVARAAFLPGWAEARLQPARSVRPGDWLFVAGPGDSSVKPAQVLWVEPGAAQVRYVLTESGRLLAGSVAAAAESTMAGSLERVPFRLLDALALLPLPPVKAALALVLESPALRRAERIADALAAALAPAPLRKGAAAAIWASALPPRSA